MSKLQLMQNELARARFFVPNGGSNIHVTDAHGVVALTFGLEAGIRDCKSLIPYLRPGDVVSWDKEIAVVTQGAERVSAVRHEDILETGANPDFQPTSATAAEVRARRMLNEVTEQAALVEKRMLAFEKAKKQADEEVVDDETGETKAEMRARKLEERKARQEQAEKEAETLKEFEEADKAAADEDA